MKYAIEKNTIQETLVIPLYGRKLCTEQFPNLFQDQKAVVLIEHIDYDFSPLEKKSKSLAHRFGALEVAMRENDLIIEAKEYLKEHPRAALVNLGCGLDQTAENCDNGECVIYNIDLPDVIAVRNELLPQNQRIKSFAADLNDFSWFDKLETKDGFAFLLPVYSIISKQMISKSCFSLWQNVFRAESWFSIPLINVPLRSC